MEERTTDSATSRVPSEIRVTATDDLAAIRAEIRQTRARMSHTVEDIGERLNPDRVKAQIKDNIHDATIGKAEHMARIAADRVDDTRHSIMDSIRDNPIPAAMVGVGLGWLFINGRRHRDEYDYRSAPGYDPRDTFAAYGYPGLDPSRRQAGFEHEARDQGRIDRAADRVSDLSHTAVERGEDLAHRAQDRVTEIAHDARDTVSDFADRAQEAVGQTASRARAAASDLAGQTRRGTHRVEDRLEDFVQESPLAVGAAAVALGLAIGLSAPASRRESELMGPTRDRLVNRATEVAEDATHRVQEAADRMADRAESRIQESTNDDSRMM